MPYCDPDVQCAYWTTYERLRKRRERAERRQAGLCYSCRTPVVRFATCFECRQKKLRYDLATRARRIARRQCISCPSMELATTRMCLACSHHAAARKRRQRQERKEFLGSVTQVA